jgi:hypothetical protein
MQFADYIVSYALQSLTRSLLRLRDHQPAIPAGDARLLVEQVGQLLSLWQMMQWSIGRLQYDSARRDLREIVALCSNVAGVTTEPAEVRGARQLLQAGETAATNAVPLPLDAFIAAFEVARQPGDPVALRDRLSCLLQAESARWREYRTLRQISDEALIEHGMLRAFERAGSLMQRLQQIGGAGERLSSRRLQRAHRWVSHCANHLELLRPALSEAGKTRRWHLTRLAAKLEDQHELEAFAQAAGSAGFKGFGLKGKELARLEKALRRERKHLARQMSKLGAGAFGADAEDYRREVEAAVEQLGLREITLLPLASRVPSRSDVEGPTA